MKKIENGNKGIWIGVAVAVVLVIIAAVATESESKQLTSSETAYDTQTMSEFKTAFMDGCVVDGNGQYTECNCVYEYLNSRLGITEFIDQSIEYGKTGQFTPAMTDAINVCY